MLGLWPDGKYHEPVNDPPVQRPPGRAPRPRAQLPDSEAASFDLACVWRSKLIAECFELRNRVHQGAPLTDRKVRRFLVRILVPVNPVGHCSTIANVR